MGFQAAGADCMNDPKIKSWEGNIGGSLVCNGRFKARRFRPRNPRNRSYCSSMSLKLPQNGCHAQPNTCVYLRFPKICSLCLSEGTGASVDRSFCEDCAEGYFGLGGSCTICPNGTEPVLGQNVSCGPCPPTTAGTLGVCHAMPGWYAAECRAYRMREPSLREISSGIRGCVDGDSGDLDALRCLESVQGAAQLARQGPVAAAVSAAIP